MISRFATIVFFLAFAASYFLGLKDGGLITALAAAVAGIALLANV